MKLLFNPENETLHCDPPTERCNLPTARKDKGPKPRHIGASEAEVRLQGQAPPRLCRWCFESPKDEQELGA